MTRPPSVIATFLRRAEAHPGLVAVRCGEQAITYADLAARSLLICRSLRGHGIEPDTVVGLEAERSIGYVTAILGILASGGACLPLDPGFPSARRRQMLVGSGAKLLIRGGDAGSAFAPDVPGRSIDELAAGGGPDPSWPDDPRDECLAYVLYTSGSTGTPKGVAMEHGALRRLIAWQIGQDEGAEGPALLFAQLSFDVSFQEMLSALCAGSELVIASEDDRRDPVRLARLLARRTIARLFLPTAYLPLLAGVVKDAPPPALRRIYLAGEALKITPAIRAFLGRASWCSLHNQYGPTETHVVTSYSLTGDPSAWPTIPPIGTPLPHAKISVRDQAGHPVQPGDVGEICIAGPCVARGYVGRSEETREGFIADPASGDRMYRTGDLGCEMNGLLHYRGRVDRQVKVRGHRVEPAEIEAVLAGCDNVAEAAVAAEVGAGGQVELVAYLVLLDAARGLAPCRERALGTLPEFMVPTVWVELPTLARTPSGKIDRATLTAQRRARRPDQTARSAPRTPTERRVADIWRALLPASEADLDDRFFDLGGTSILFIHMQVAIRAEFGITAPVAALYERPSIRLMARWIDGGAGGTLAPTDRARAPARPRENDAGAVAIVGMSCRFPGATSVARFWSNLCAGVDSITRVARPERGPAFVGAAGQLPGIEAFDAAFFGLSSRDADILDPQHRLFLECAHEALEDAGIDPRRVGGRVGVFGGCGPSTYLLNNLLPALGGRGDRNLIASVDELQLLMANDKDYLTSQVSYRLDLTGPSVNVNAACATALAAVHLARRSLLAGECEVALAGAANVPVPQLDGYLHEPGMVFAPDGYCRAFDEAAAGAVFGSGVGVVALRPLADAIQDGDDLYAVIRGSAFANDGGLKAGFSAPSEEGQARVIRQALGAADISADRIGLLEAHGTATAVGDAIEVAALHRVFAGCGTRHRVLGSVKPNVGHLGWAAGMAGLIKAALAIRHRRIPPTLHVSQVHPALRLEESGLRVNTGAPCDWPATDDPLCAGVSAFGLGGASAHVVMEEAPARRPRRIERAGRARVIPLGARDPEALAALESNLAAHLGANPDIGLDDVALTTSTGRQHHDMRRALVARTRDEFVAQLARLASHRSRRASSARVVGLFTGQGAEHRGMGQQLYEAEPVFRRVMDDGNAQMLAEGVDLLSWLFDRSEENVSKRIDLVQPAVFTLQMALVALWRSWGVDFDATIGHSLGEFAAAATAGVFGFEDGLGLVAERGRLLKSLSDDAAMAVVFADEPSVRGTIEQRALRAWVASANSEFNTVISGTKADVAAACEVFTAGDVEVRALPVSRAGHSALIEPIRAAFEDAAARVPMRPPRIDLASNVTGRLAGADVTHPDYWGRHLCETVRFADGLETIARSGVGAFIEVGAAPHLIGIGAASYPDTEAVWLASMRPGEDEGQVLARSLADLYEAGFDLDWASVQGGRGRRVHLPTYPYQRTRHWIEAPPRGRGSAEVVQARGDDVGGGELGFQIEWHPSTGTSRCARPGRWILFADRGGAARALAREIRAAQGSVTLVASGSGCGWIQEGEFSVRAGSLADLERLFAAHAGEEVARIVNLWGLDVAAPLADDPREKLTEALRVPLELGLMLGRWAGANGRRPIPVAIVTRGAQRVLPTDDTVDPLQSALWGFARTAALEDPEAKFTRVDVPSSGDVRASALLSALADDTEPELALRGGALLASRLCRRTVPGAEAPPLRPDGSYLITGGLGGLGLWSAQELARHGVRRLVLVGRREPDASARAAIGLLRDRGLDVAVIQADIAVPAVAAHLVAEASRNGTPVRGIVHCAGVIDDAALGEQTWERVETVLRPKVQGAWNLLAATTARGCGLDFLLLQSSATSVLGNFGQAAHGAACAFLDGLAHRLRLRGVPAVSVNWGAWSDVGYLTGHPGIVAQLEQRGMGSIAAATGARLLLALLSSREAQWAILPNDWAVYLRNQGRASDPFFARLGSGPVRPEADDLSAARRLARAAPDRRRPALLAVLRDEARRLLGTRAAADATELDADCPLRDLGLDSLGAIQLRNVLQTRLTVSLPPRLVYEHPTIRALADYLLREVLTDGWREALAMRADEAPPPPSADAGTRVGGTAGLSVQQRRWLRLIRDVDYGQRVVPIVFHATLDRRVFQDALSYVVGRHEILRCVFPGDRARLLSTQRLVPAADAFADLRGLDDGGRVAEVRRQVGLCRVALGDPADHPSWAIRCLEIEPSQFVVLLGLQHLAFDGTSLSVFVEELRGAYLAGLVGGLPELPVAMQYSAYTAQQRAYMEGAITGERPFFEGLYAGLGCTTALAGHHGFARTTARASQRFTADAPLADWREVCDAARRIAASPFAVLLSSYATLVGELTSSSQVVVGVIANGRGDARFNRTIGPFTSPFPVPVMLGRDPAALALSVDRVMAAITARATYPAVDLINFIEAFKGFPLDTYFTDTCINFLNYRREEPSMALRVDVLEILGPVSRPEFAACGFDQLRRIPGFHLVADVCDEALRANYWFHTERFAERDVASWAVRHKAIMADLLAACRARP